MITFFRRFITSRVGVIVTLVVLGVIAFAFATSDISNLGGGTTSLSGPAIAEVGGTKVTSAEARNRTQSELEAYRQQTPGLDMIQFVTGGGLEATIDRIVNGFALEQFAQSQGMVASKKLVDGRIASIPAFKNATGKFDQTTYESLLKQRGISEAELRSDIARDTLIQQLLVPTEGARQVSETLALPYASILLEKRAGRIAFVPITVPASSARPTPQEIQAYYTANVTRYTVPERRVIRYATVTAERFTGRTTPSEAEVAAAYKTEAARFAAKEERTITQVILADQAAATALAAKARAGTTMEIAARAVGLEAVRFDQLDRTELAAATAAPVAQAAFAAPDRGIAGPIRSPLGWHVLKVESITQLAGQTLDQARPQLINELTTRKTAAAIQDLRARLEDSASEGATFDEIVKATGLTGQTTAPLLVDGRNPDDPATSPAPELTPILRAGFDSEPGDDPQLVTLGQEDRFALVKLERVVPAAPRPLAQIRERVGTEFLIDRASRAARTIAQGIVTRVTRGATIEAALAEAKVALPPVQRVAGTRAQLTANRERVPPPLALLFSMAERRAKLLEAPGKTGWYVIYLDEIEPGSAAGNAGLLTATRAQLGRVVGQEYIAQFSAAVKAEVGVKKNAAAIAQLKRDLTGQAPGSAN